MYKVGDKWITEHQERNIIEMERNKEIFEGEHWEVFKPDVISRLKLGYQVSEEGYFQNMLNGKVVSTGVSAESFFVSENMLGECTDTYTTLMLTEMPKIISESNQAWVDDTIKNTKLHDTLVAAANNQSCIGWAAIKTRLEDEQPEIELIDNKYIFVYPKQNNRNKIDYIMYAYKLESGEGKDKIVTLVTEEHYIDKIIYVNYLIENDTVKAIIPPVMDGEHPERRYETYYSWEENTTGNFLIHILNNSKTDGLLADTDYTDTAVTAQREYAVRATQTAISMDKTLNPTMQVPEGLFTKNPITGKSEANVIGKAIPTAEGDKEVKFIEYNGNYDIVMKYEDTLRASIYREMAVAPIVFDIGDGANIPSGTALKKAMFRTVAEVRKKQTQMTNVIQAVLNIAYNLQTGGDLGDLTVKWLDPVPLDRLEEAQIAVLRTGNQPTQSQKEAIMVQDDKTEEQALKSVEEINKNNIQDAKASI